jgi:hypothetical protein
VTALIVAWYGWLGAATQGPVFVLRDLADAVSFPLVSAVLFGSIGALSPCQLTTNLGALAYASARPGGAPPLALTGAFVAGKVSVYALVGAAAVMAGVMIGIETACSWTPPASGSRRGCAARAPERGRVGLPGAVRARIVAAAPRGGHHGERRHGRARGHRRWYAPRRAASSRRRRAAAHRRRATRHPRVYWLL